MIEVLKQALTDAKRNERHNNVAETRYWLNQYKLIAEQAIAELESQEPVAWRWKTHNGYAYSEQHYEGEDGQPLYTHPPQRTDPKVCCQQYDTCLEPCTPRGEHLAQRTWVGLTDEDCRGMSAGDRVIAMWANRTLKEKNT
jgi:hypothetical protein